MFTQEKEVNWRLAIRASLILGAAFLTLSNTFHVDRIACQVCWQDVTKHYFAFFGFFSAFGFAIGWTLPERQSDSGHAIQWNTRQGFWEGSMGAGALLTIGFAVTHFLG